MLENEERCGTMARGRESVGMLLNYVRIYIYKSIFLFS